MSSLIQRAYRTSPWIVVMSYSSNPLSREDPALPRVVKGVMKVKYIRQLFPLEFQRG